MASSLLTVLTDSFERISRRDERLATISLRRRHRGLNQPYGPLVIYTWLFALILARIDTERVHTAVSWTLRKLNRVRPLRALARKLLFPKDDRLKVRAMGLEFPTPLGLAAGFDKDAKTFDAYATLGF